MIRFRRNGFFEIIDIRPHVFIDYDEEVSFNSLTCSIADLEKIQATIAEIPDGAENITVEFSTYTVSVYFSIEKENPKYDLELLRYSKKLSKFKKQLQEYNAALPSYLTYEKAKKEIQLEKEYRSAKAKVKQLEKKLSLPREK